MKIYLIQESIKQAEYTENDLKNNCIGIRLIADEGSFYMHTKSELLHLLSLVAEKQHKSDLKIVLKGRDKGWSLIGVNHAMDMAGLVTDTLKENGKQILDPEIDDEAFAPRKDGLKPNPNER